MNVVTDNKPRLSTDLAGHRRTNHHQSALITDIFTQSSLSGVPERALKIYQQNLQMTAARSLSISYPVLQQMVGEQAMFILAQRLLAWEKPATGDWADWGSQLGQVIESSELAGEHPYLADIARLEWALQVVGRSTVNAFDRASLQLLTEVDPEHLTIKLQPSLTVLESPFPVQPMWQLHRDSHGQHDLSEGLEIIMQHRANTHFAVVYQQHNKPKADVVDQQQYAWLQGVQHGMHLAALLDTYPGIDFAQWLSQAIERQWIETILSPR